MAEMTKEIFHQMLEISAVMKSEVDVNDEALIEQFMTTLCNKFDVTPTQLDKYLQENNEYD